MLASALAAAPVCAQPDDPGAPPEEAVEAPSEDPSTIAAREAFRLGSTLAKQSQWLEALAAFERSASLLEHPITTYNVGFCERALGRYTRAKKALTTAIAQGAAGSAGARLPENLRREAEGYLVEIDRKLARVAVVLEQPDTAIAFDGRPLERAPDGPSGRVVMLAGTREPGAPEVPPARTLEVLVDPGAHVVVIVAPGVSERVIDQRFAPGEVTRLHLRVRDAAPEPPVQPAPAPPPDVPATAEASPDYTWAILAYGIGGAGIVTGSIFGIAALNEKSALDDVCPEPNQCPEESERPGTQDDIDTMKRFALVSSIGFGVGIAGAAVGTLLVFTAPGGDPPRADARRRPTVSPFVGLGSAGVRGAF